MYINMETLENAETHQELIYSAEDSPVRTLVSPLRTENQKALQANARGYGNSTPVYLGSLDLQSSSLKTAQGSLFQDSNTSYATLPDAGICVNGDLYMLPNLATRIIGKERTVWPTPLAADGMVLLSKVESYIKLFNRPTHATRKLIYYCHLSGMSAIQTMNLYEWMMGFEKDWTLVESTDAETQS